MDNFFLLLFSVLILITAFKTITHRDPAYGALYLALTMVLLAFCFFVLGAPFLAGLQLIIYAGAVMVLFVMVLMLFDFKKEKFLLFKKSSWLAPLFLLGMFFGLILLTALSSPSTEKNTDFFSSVPIAFKLFTKYVLLFELMGLVLLVIAIGVVALSRLDKE